jgi:hypothetical protein
MAYVSLTFWLLIAVGAAWGTQRLWLDLTKPRVFNVILLPGTLVAQTGHILGLLVTGATVRNASLIKDDESGDPETTTDPEPKIPVVGPIIIGLLPLLACVTAVFVIAEYLGRPIATRLPAVVTQNLPTSLDGMWQLLRDQITLTESMFNALISADLQTWTTWLFVYLLICFTIRLAPLPGNLRGSIGAILVLGIGGAALASLFDAPDPRSSAAWSVLNLTIATLSLLLLVTLLVRGGASLVQTLRGTSSTA